MYFMGLSNEPQTTGEIVVACVGMLAILALGVFGTCAFFGQWFS